MTRLSALLALLALTSPRAAELGTEPMSVAFDYSEIDLRNDEQHYRGNVRISQGALFIASDQAMAKGAARSDTSRWTFERNVHLRTQDSDLRADSAVALVVNGEISRATVKGSPAVFEQRDSTADKPIRGRAGEIEYDVARGIVRLSNDVWFSYGENEFRGAVVVYYTGEERVVVNPGGKDQGRVNITVRPQSIKKPGEIPAAAPEAKNSR